MSSPRLDQQLCFAIYTAGHAFGRVYKPLLDELGLTYSQYLVMMALWGEDGQTVRGIGQKLFLESSTLTPLLKRLETQGLLSRTRDKQDERQVRVHLTADGRKLGHKARDVPACMLKASGVTLETLSRLKKEVEGIRDNLLAAAEADTPRDA